MRLPGTSYASVSSRSLTKLPSTTFDSLIAYRRAQYDCEFVATVFFTYVVSPAVTTRRTPSTTMPVSAEQSGYPTGAGWLAVMSDAGVQRPAAVSSSTPAYRPNVCVTE